MTGVFMKKTEVLLDKPIMIGQTILDYAKEHMYKFHYEVMKPKYGEKIKLLMTDTDSFIYEIECEDVYSDMYDKKETYDLTAFPKDFIIKGGKNKGKCLHDSTNNKVIGKFKDELSQMVMTEFVGLKSKMYSFRKEVQD
jgi:hypothetical protein